MAITSYEATVSGAQTVTVTSGMSFLIAAIVSPFSGVASLSGDVWLIVDAISGVSSASSGKVMWQAVASTQSGTQGLPQPASFSRAFVRSGIVATGAANSYLAVVYAN